MSTPLERIFSLKDKSALVTGASGGIGRVLAVALAEAGAMVAVHGTNPGRIEDTRQVIQKAGGRCMAVAARLESVGECQRLVNEARRELGRLDILIHCAGTNRRRPIDKLDAEDFEHIVAVNLRSTLFVCQQVHPIMRDQGGGKIITIGSVTASEGLGGVSIYGATKAAVAQLTKTMALEWARDNIQVNCLAPGFIVTPLTEVGLWSDPHRKQWLLERIPARRPGRPEELVGAALLLASNASSYLTGQIINVDGGYLAGGSWLQENE
jgi:NAD(P)-dependent dehydrogenase (short-subunit alcohol dehydrogenase family)